MSMNNDVPRTRATMRKWFSEKGFGFATIEKPAAPAGPRRVMVPSRDEDVFVHVRSLCAHLRDDHSKTEAPAIDQTTGRALAGVRPWPDVYIASEPGDKGPRAREAICAWCESAPERALFE